MPRLEAKPPVRSTLVRLLVGAAIKLILGRRVPSPRLRIITVKTEALVEMPLACMCMEPAVITLALVLFLGGVSMTLGPRVLDGLSSPVFLLASLLVGALVISGLGSRPLSPYGRVVILGRVLNPLTNVALQARAAGLTGNTLEVLFMLRIPPLASP